MCLCLFIGGICGYVYSDTVEATVENMANNSICKFLHCGTLDSRPQIKIHTNLSVSKSFEVVGTMILTVVAINRL